MAPWLARHVNDAFVQGAVYINTALGAGVSYSLTGVSFVLHFYLIRKPLNIGAVEIAIN
jgi:hypothetical protein